MRLPTSDVFDLRCLLRNRYLPWIANILLLWLIAWQLWHVLIFFKQSPVQQSEFSEMPQPVQSEQKREDIARMHLFGLSAVDQAPQTQLNLQLKSTFQSSQAVDSQALIELNAVTKAYRINDVLPGGAVIESILSDRVLIRNHGTVEALLLQRPYPNLEERFGN